MENKPEHIVSEAMKKPPAPHPKEDDAPVVFTASVNIKQPVPVTKNG